MTPQKISILVPDVSSLGTTRAYIIAQGLQKIGYEVKILGFIFGEQMYPEPPYNIPIAYIGGSKLPNLVKIASKFLADIEGDILYVIKPQLTSFGLALLKTWRKKNQKPIIIDLDDWEIAKWGEEESEYEGNLFSSVLSARGKLANPQHPVYLRALENMLDRVNGITVSSKFLEFRYGGTYLPNCVNTEVYNRARFDRQQIRQQIGLDDFKLVMITGTVKPNQGIEELLEALAKLNNPQIRLFLLGGNPQYNEYRQQLYQKWSSLLILSAARPFLETAGLIEVADIILVCPTDEPTQIARCPLELVEAMAMAKPIVASTVGDIPIILGDTGYLVPPNSPETIVETINLILNEEQEEAINKGKLARQRCQENYSLDNLAKTLEQVMSMVIEN